MKGESTGITDLTATTGFSFCREVSESVPAEQLQSLQEQAEAAGAGPG